MFYKYICKRGVDDGDYNFLLIVYVKFLLIFDNIVKNKKK